MESPGQWLEKSLLDLCRNTESGLNFDGDLISGLVSYCDLASLLDAKEYLDNIIGQEAGKRVIEEYLRRRGHTEAGTSNQKSSNTKLHVYVKPPSNENLTGSKKPSRAPKEAAASTSRENTVTIETNDKQRGNQAASSKKKKSGKVISLAEAAKGSIVFNQGKPCSCQARRHRLVSNCLSCGKVVCEQEGEGPCSFCGALVLMEGSKYAGLDFEGGMPLSDAEVAAEAFAKRLVEYDRNSAARTTVIDDQSDYYEIEGNNWISMEEKELLRKKKEELDEAEKAKRSKVIVSFDLVGRKVLVNEDEVSVDAQNTLLLRPPDEREANRIKPNPTLRIQPVFVDPGPSNRAGSSKGNSSLHRNHPHGLCLQISGRVQHDTKELKGFVNDEDQLITA
jgi:hypothetical protein